MLHDESKPMTSRLVRASDADETIDDHRHSSARSVLCTDLIESDAYRKGEPNRRALVDLGGARCLLAEPLLKDEGVVGNVMIFRQEKRLFRKSRSRC